MKATWDVRVSGQGPTGRGARALAAGDRGGIAIYRSGKRDHDALLREWDVIRRRFPNSTWWARADVFDARPTGRRD